MLRRVAHGALLPKRRCPSARTGESPRAWPWLRRTPVRHAAESPAARTRREPLATRRPRGRGRHAKDRHHGIANELLDGSAMSFQARACRLEIASHHRAERFGVELLAHGRRPRNVCEKHRHDLPRLAPTRTTELGTARGAETRVVRIDAPAAFARRHARSVREIPSRTPLAPSARVSGLAP